MIIENRDGLTILYAEGTSKITDKKRTLYTDCIYLAKEDKVENYEEVARDIWKNYVDENPNLEDVKEDLKILEEKVDVNKTEVVTINQPQDEMILCSMESVADSYEQMLNVETATSENQNNILISMDAIAELYETILNLQTELESLKGGDSNGNSNSDNIL